MELGSGIKSINKLCAGSRLVWKWYKLKKGQRQSGVLDTLAQNRTAVIFLYVKYCARDLECIESHCLRSKLCISIAARQRVR